MNEHEDTPTFRHQEVTLGDGAEAYLQLREQETGVILGLDVRKRIEDYLGACSAIMKSEIGIDDFLSREFPDTDGMTTLEVLLDDDLGEKMVEEWKATVREPTVNPDFLNTS